MKTSTVLVVSFQFESFHCWPNAPEVHSYLGRSHRHIFHVEAAASVVGMNREVEFIVMKRILQNKTMERYVNTPSNPHPESCEMMANWLLHEMYRSGYSPEWVKVSEDNENAAYVFNDESTPSAPRPSLEECEPTDELEECEPTDEFEESKTPDKSTRLASRFGPNCFIGYEAEGPLLGRPTLFIPYEKFLLSKDYDSEEDFDVEFERVFKIYHTQNVKPRHVYLGASNSLWEQAELPCVLEVYLTSYDDITVEIDDSFSQPMLSFIKNKSKGSSYPCVHIVIRNLSGETKRRIRSMRNSLGVAVYEKKLTSESIVWEPLTSQADSMRGSQVIHNWTTSYNHPLFGCDVQV